MAAICCYDDDVIEYLYLIVIQNVGPAEGLACSTEFNIQWRGPVETHRLRGCVLSLASSVAVAFARVNIDVITS